MGALDMVILVFWQNHSIAIKKKFFITGSQTGKIKELTSKHYCIVTDCKIEKNLIYAKGSIKPSSESLTHGILYQTDDNLRCVIHVHSPDIWKNAKTLNILTTDKHAEYGTPEMAKKIKKLYEKTRKKGIKLFAMSGHEDGVLSFGESLDEAGFALIKCLIKAFSLQ